MSHKPAAPTTDAAANSTGSDAEPSTRLARQQKRFRMWQAKSAQAEHSPGRPGFPKRRQPSMPKLPWNDA